MDGATDPHVDTSTGSEGGSVIARDPCDAGGSIEDLPARIHRCSGEVAAGELRSPFEKDRDRVLYSHAFLRLAGVTQVSSTSPAGSHHSRFTHSVKVAQVGAAIARTLIDRYRRTVPTVTEMVDPYVVEAAGLAHDIGHPPGGHNGEAALSKWAQNHVGEMFEGNAQTFRILTRLGDRIHDRPGLDLTRATLLASTKYPWSSGDERASATNKFGYYESDAEVFQWAARDTQAAKGVPTLEAQIMDWADDITYAIHDTQDWYRSGEIPLDELVAGGPVTRDYADQLWEAVMGDSKLKTEYAELAPLADAKMDKVSPNRDAFVATVVDRFCTLGNTFVGLDQRGVYEGAHQQRSILVYGAARMLGQVIEGPTDRLTPMPFSLRNSQGAWYFTPDPALKLDILLLKGLLFWKVVPSLADEQSAEWTQLTELADKLLGVLRGEEQRHLVGELAEVRGRFGELTPSRQAAYVLDLVAGLTDVEFRSYHALYCQAKSGHELTQRAREAAIPPWPFDGMSQRDPADGGAPTQEESEN